MRPLRILIVEDNADSRESLKHLLMLKGHQVYEATDGPSAIEAILRERPHVALMDIGLPELDGYEVARQVRSQPGSQDTMLVALTGYGLETDRERARDAGFDAHLVKPLDPVKLNEVLATCGGRGGDSAR